MKYNTITKQVAETVPGGVYEGIDYHGTPPADVAARAGWVDVTPEIQAQIDADAAAALVEFEAAEVERKNTPLAFDQPIEAPALVVHTVPAARAVGMVSTADGEIVTFEYHASPVPSPAEIAARKQAAVDALTAHRNRITGIKTDLDQVETALDGLDLTNAGPLGLAIAATSGATKTAFNRTQDALQSLKTAAKNLRQACEKLRKEVK
jgi:hypothetical protein